MNNFDDNDDNLNNYMQNRIEMVYERAFVQISHNPK